MADRRAAYEKSGGREGAYAAVHARADVCVAENQRLCFACLENRILRAEKEVENDEHREATL
jgi:hypothetical protein